MPFKDINGLRYFQFNSIQADWLDHGIFTRRGGISQGPYSSLNVGATVGDDLAHVRENKRRVFEALNRPANSSYEIWQVHSATILVADEPRQGEPFPKADGVITDRKGITLSMRFADCVPIMLVDPLNRAVGMVHAGWQGTLRGVASAAVQQMISEFGSDPSTLLAGIGPAIRQHHYPVGDEVVDAFRQKFGQPVETRLQTRGTDHLLDLIGANIDALEDVGVGRIEDSGICTACNLEDWFSHRGQAGQAGRFVGILGIN